jgi:predicted Holliday junction resolvase-like endonuclease
MAHNPLQEFVAITVLILLAVALPAEQKSVETLKAEAERASGGHRARLYAELAQQLVEVADQQFTDAKITDAQATVQEVLKYASLARDLSIKTRSKMKETEIHLRSAERRLTAVRRTLSVDDRPPLEEVEKKIERFRQDLLDEMFAPPKKEKRPS